MVLCELEARTRREDGLDELFEIAEIWLQRYSDGDPAKITADPFHISKPMWNERLEEKLHYLNNFREWRSEYELEGGEKI